MKTLLSLGLAMFLSSCGAVRNGDMVAVQWGGRLTGLHMASGGKTIDIQEIDNVKSFEDFTTLGGKLGRAKLMYAPAVKMGSGILSKGLDKIPK